MLKPSILKAYNQYRKNTDKSKVCHAPFVNLNFEQNGHVTACCFNRVDVLGVYPENSLMGIWKGTAAEEMRQKIEDLDLTDGCKLCGILLESGNFSGSKAIHYDEYAPYHPLDKFLNTFRKNKYQWPKVMEFEISNTCNLECEMCSGYYSSTIRKNREQLPPIHDPYDDEFVSQLEDFIPHLTDMKFLGGEPFLIDRYYQIWEKVVELHPDVKIHITTNGTVFNQRVKNLLEKLRVGIVVSLDSLHPERYASIRKGSQLDKVLKNISSFQEIVRKKGTYITIAACVMTNNWMDMPDLLRYCNEQQLNLHYNMVWNPEKFSLRFLSYEELSKILDQLASEKFEISSKLHHQNYQVYQEMISTIEHWKKERSHTRLQEVEVNVSISKIHIDVIQRVPNNLQERFYVLMEHYLQNKSELLSIWSENISDREVWKDKSKNLFSYLKELSQKEGDEVFIKNQFLLLTYIYELFYSEEGRDAFISKSSDLLAHILKYDSLENVVSDMIEDLDKKSIMASIELLRVNTVENLILHMDTIYST